MKAESFPKKFRLWVILSVAILVGSLLLLVTTVTLAFVLYQNESTPIWVVVPGVLAVLGVGLGFLGLFGVLGFAAWQSFREERTAKAAGSTHDDTKDE